jgi:hypothetical protein
MRFDGATLLGDSMASGRERTRFGERIAQRSQRGDLGLEGGIRLAPRSGTPRRRRARLLSSPGGSRTTTTTSTIRKKSRRFFVVLVLVVVLDCFIAFPAGQTEDDDDHEHDQEKSRRFFIVLVLVVASSCSIGFPEGSSLFGRQHGFWGGKDPHRGKASRRGHGGHRGGI